MNEILKTEIFAKWLARLKDLRGKALILNRIEAAEEGNFGDCGSVGGKVSEMRIHYGPGYRVYFTAKSGVIYILLCGGTKRGQKRDIEKAREMAKMV